MGEEEDALRAELAKWKRRFGELWVMYNDSQDIVRQYEQGFAARNSGGEHAVLQASTITSNQEESLKDSASQDLLQLAPTAPAAEVAPARVVAPPYQEVVRGKAARAALPGHACEECRSFYATIKDTLHPNEDLQTVMDRYSKHRHRHKPPSTPPGYWDVWSLGIDQEEQEEQAAKRCKPGNVS